MSLIPKGFPEVPAADFTSTDLKARPKKAALRRENIEIVRYVLGQTLSDEGRRRSYLEQAQPSCLLDR